jgi:TusA-related sulfurtransferase
MDKPAQNFALDITGEVCPMTFVRVKLTLAQIPSGAVLAVRLREGEALTNVPRSLRQEGHEIVSIDPQSEGIHRLVVRKK